MTQSKLPSDAPPPRRCVIEKLPGENEYGYNLHAEKNRGQFVGLVDAGSPAQRGGLIQGDRIFAVNGHSIIGENHKKVVERIKAKPERCEMLVLEEDGVKWYQDHNIQITLEILEQALENSAMRPSNGSPPPSSWYAPTTYSQQPSTWFAYLYATIMYYLSLIASHLPRYERITDDKPGEIGAAGGSADVQKTAGAEVETQTLKAVTVEEAAATTPAATDPSSLSFDCNCLTPHLSATKTCSSPTYVSTLSLPPQQRRRSALKKPPVAVATETRTTPKTLNSSSSSSFPSTTSIPSTVSFRRSPSPSSSESSGSTVSPSKSIIAVVPSGSHVLVGIPKLDWKTDSIRIKRTRMSEWLDAEQRDVMRQFDEVIRNEEEEDEKVSKRKGILKNGSVRSIGSTTRSRSKLQETPVFVPPPPPPTTHYDHTPDTMAPLPRLAKLEKSYPEQEFGFNLHAEREKGHFIGIVDENGIGQKAGLEMGQRIVGVNGKLIYPNTGHKEVVTLIKKSPMSTTLLVVSEETDKWHRDHGVAYSFDHYEQPPTHPIEVETHHHEEVHAAVPAKTNGYEVAPALNPHSIQVNEEREISKMTTTTKTEVISTNSYQYKVSTENTENQQPVVITTCSFLNETTTAYDAYAAPPAENSEDLMAQVFGKVDLPAVGNQVTILSHTKELSNEDASSVSSLSSHRESAVDVPVNHQYVPSYVSQSHQHEDRHSQTQNHHHQQHQQPSPLSNGSSHGYAASSTSGYDDDDIYHLSAKEARERLRMKNRKHHMHEMSLTEKYQLVSNM